MGSLGGVEEVVGVVKRFQSSSGQLLRSGVDALWNLTFDDEAVDKATDAGAIEQVVQVMKAHEGVSELQSSACAVLLNLAVREPNRWRIIQAGAVGLVASAMERHSASEEVLEQGCQALYMLAYHPDLRPHIMASRGADAAKLAAASRFSGGRVQKWGTWLQEVLDC